MQTLTSLEHSLFEAILAHYKKLEAGENLKHIILFNYVPSTMTTKTKLSVKVELDEKRVLHIYINDQQFYGRCVDVTKATFALHASDIQLFNEIVIAILILLGVKNDVHYHMYAQKSEFAKADMLHENPQLHFFDGHDDILQMALAIHNSQQLSVKTITAQQLFSALYLVLYTNLDDQNANDLIVADFNDEDEDSQHHNDFDDDDDDFEEGNYIHNY